MYKCFYLRSKNGIRGAIVWNMEGTIGWAMCHPSDRSKFSKEVARSMAISRIEAGRKTTITLGKNANPRIIDHVLKCVASLSHSENYPDALRHLARRSLRERAERMENTDFKPVVVATH